MQTNSGQARHSLWLWVVMLALLCGPAAAKDSGLSLLLLPPIAGDGNPQLAISWKGVAAGRIDLDVIDDAGSQRRLISRILDPGMHVEDVDVSGTDRRLVAVLRDTQGIEIARAETTVSAVLPPLDVGAPEMAGANDAPPSPAIERLGTTVDWKATFGGNGGPNGTVRAMTIYDDGSGPALVIGGDFTTAGGVVVNRVARWNGSTWSAFGRDAGSGVGSDVTNAVVEALAVLDGDLYVGGRFTQANLGGVVVPANGIARWNGSTWSSLGSGGGNGVGSGVSPPSVSALVAMGGDLYLGGRFTEANIGGVAVSANGVARWNGSSWSALGSGGGNGVNGGIDAFAVIGQEIYVGGSFTQANAGGPAVPANNVARWTGTEWTALDGGGGNGVDGVVLALATSAGDLYVGGSFSTSNLGGLTVATRNIARWNGSSWSAVGSGGGNGLNLRVNELLIGNGKLYAGGLFEGANFGGTIVPANRVARWDPATSTWSALGGGVGGLVGEDFEFAEVWALAVLGDDVLAGGDFARANVGGIEVPANHLARWDGAQWSVLGSAGAHGVDRMPVLSNSTPAVNAVAVVGNDLYVGGRFRQANFGGSVLKARNIARWNGTQWSALGTADGNGLNGPVFALAAIGTDLVVGGDFTRAYDGTSEVIVNRIARWSGIGWSALGSGGGNGFNSFVSALKPFNGELYVGGSFTQANVGAAAVTANRIARWNGSSWSPLGSGGGNGLNGWSVDALEFLGADLYVGGSFTQANLGGPVVEANNIARWNQAGWTSVGNDGGNGVGGVPSPFVSALAARDGALYVGGSFAQANQGGPVVEARNIARWNGGNWSALGANGGNGVNRPVFELAWVGPNLVVGGVFDQANAGSTPVVANYLALWNGSVWKSLGQGVTGAPFFFPSVSALGAYNADLIVGGVFTIAGDLPANFIAAYGPADSTSTWITSSLPSPSFPGDPVQIRVRVVGDTAPTIGHVTVTGAPGGSCSDLTLTPINGTTSEAECTIRWSNVGTRTLTARYIGGKDWLPSTSAPFAHAVTDLLFGNGFETSP